MSIEKTDANTRVWNSPAEQYTLESIPGSFSGLHPLCIQYPGFQILDPLLDLGFDLSAEYQAALQMHKV